MLTGYMCLRRWQTSPKTNFRDSRSEDKQRFFILGAKITSELHTSQVQHEVHSDTEESVSAQMFHFHSSQLVDVSPRTARKK